VFANGNEALFKNWTTVNADGNPIYTADQIAAKDQKYKQALFSQAAKSYMQAQPDKLKAYDDWLNDRVSIELPEGSINIGKLMSPDVRGKVDAELKQIFKEDLAIKKQLLEAQEVAQNAALSKRVMGDVMQGFITLDPTSKDNKKLINDYWGQQQDTLIKQGASLHDILDSSLDIVAKTGVIPSSIESVLTANIRNGNIEQRATYSKYILDAADINPKFLDTLDKETQVMAVSIATNLRSGLSAEQAVEWVINDLNEAKKEDIKTRSNAWQGDKKYQDKRQKTFVSEMQDESGFDLFSRNPEVPAEMVNEYNRLSKGYFVNEKASAKNADQMAEKIIRGQWGVTEIGGTKRYMKFAPELIYGNGGNTEWIYSQLEERYNTPKQDLIIEANPASFNDQKPNYFIYKRDEFGGLDLQVLDNGEVTFTPNYLKSREAQIQSDITRSQFIRQGQVLKEELEENKTPNLLYEILF
jgi:hypothetical protein